MILELSLWVKLILAVAVAFLISFAMTPIVKSFAVKVGAIDVPTEKRRVHDHPIPRMGGLAIFLGFTQDKLLSILIMYIGRLGPLTVASLWYFSRGERISYPEGNLSIG